MTPPLNLADMLAEMKAQTHRNLAYLMLDIDQNPDAWRASIWKALSEGCYLELRVGFGTSGLIDAGIDLVNNRNGERMHTSSISELRGLGVKV